MYSQQVELSDHSSAAEFAHDAPDEVVRLTRAALGV
jgi:hypothetical protein